ncbi:type II toxin-antitoxin system HicB family antitoxin [Nostoc sp.]|uniref:type II toxin-antitoxin system HicB family antitoxin n=1 Tax=Nostoc sp. TaxID=1180 RepID=UPI002FFA3F24
MNLTIEIQEEDGRFLAEVIGFPGVLLYGQTKEAVFTRVQALALRVLADKRRTWGSNAQQQLAPVQPKNLMFLTKWASFISSNLHLFN